MCVCFSHTLVRRNRKIRNVEKHTQRGEGQRERETGQPKKEVKQRVL